MAARDLHVIGPMQCPSCDGANTFDNVPNLPPETTPHWKCADAACGFTAPTADVFRVVESLKAVYGSFTAENLPPRMVRQTEWFLWYAALQDETFLHRIERDNKQQGA